MIDILNSAMTAPATGKTVSLLKLDGTDAMGTASQIKDSANPDRIWTLNSGASVITERQKFGTKSLKINGGIGLTTPHDPTMFAGSTITLEMWVYIYDYTAWSFFFSKSPTDAQTPFLRHVTNNKRLNVGYDNGSGGDGNTSYLFVDGQWAHVALTINGNTKILWLNGVAIRTDSTAGQTFGQLAQACSIGSNNRRQALDTQGKFYAQAFRISNVVRYSAGFTPPASMFVLD